MKIQRHVSPVQNEGKRCGAISTCLQLAGSKDLLLARRWVLDCMPAVASWRSWDFPLGSHLLEVTEGGWSAEENEQQGLDCSRREWLAVTGNACVSVFCHAEPEVLDCSGSIRLTDAIKK